MRVRDLKWYILASIIIIISYAAVSLCYYLSVKNGLVENSMKAISIEIAEGKVNLIDDKIDNYYDLYISDDNNNLSYKYQMGRTEPLSENEVFEICPYQALLQNRFEPLETKYPDSNMVLLAQDSIFNPEHSNDLENAGEAQDSKYYLYFRKSIENLSDIEKIELTGSKDNNYMISRVSINKILSSVDDKLISDSNRQILMFATETKVGEIIYASSSLVKETDYSIGVSGLLATNYADYINKVNDVKTINRRYSVNGVDNIVSAYQYKTIKNYTTTITGISLATDIYVATIIPTTDAILGSDWVIQQALIMFFAGIIVLLGMLGLFILGTRKASQLLRADRHSVEATKAVVIRIDNKGHVIFTNQTFKQIYGVDKLLTVDEVIDVQTNEPILATIKQNKGFECKLEDSDGNVKYLQLTPLYISSSYYLMGTEITQDYNRRKHLEIMSGRNEYTNLENGFMLANQYESILDANIGYDTAFIEYNIYKYEDIIGVFGQTSFNALLLEILKVLKDIYPEMKIFHVTDAKFWIVYPHNDINQVIERINKTLDIFQRPFEVKQNNIYVQTKIVVYNFKKEDYDEQLTDPSKKISLETIRTKLDLAYKNIKNLTGRNYIIYDPTMDSVILASDEMEKDIEQGLINHEFEMYLQPQFDIVANKIAGFEALIRWHNPKYKDKSPQLFIELAEQRGHMLDIGKFVITESFKLAKKLEPYKIHVSVNVSPVQLLQVGFVQQLIDEFNKLELKEGSVAVEITETLLMGNFQLVTEKLKLLRDRGFSIHLDDFGTGYSSMLYLKDLPVDTIKIDKEFTKFIETNKTSEAIVKTICNLGTSLNLGIICEGVETQTQSDMVKKFGCRVIQGYLIGKAMPFDDALELIEKYIK